jgi:hypothetical protein
VVFVAFGILLGDGVVLGVGVKLGAAVVGVGKLVIVSVAAFSPTREQPVAVQIRINPRDTPASKPIMILFLSINLFMPNH